QRHWRCGHRGRHYPPALPIRLPEGTVGQGSSDRPDRLPACSGFGMMEPTHMTNAAAPPVSASRDTPPAIARWFAAKDPDRLIMKRSVRAAVIMPGVFAITHFV